MLLTQWWQCSNSYTCSTSQAVRNGKNGQETKPKQTANTMGGDCSYTTWWGQSISQALVKTVSMSLSPSHTQHKLSLLQMLIYRENYQVESEQCECYMDINDALCTVSALRCFWQSNKMTSQYDQNESSKTVLILVFFVKIISQYLWAAHIYPSQQPEMSCKYLLIRGFVLWGATGPDCKLIFHGLLNLTARRGQQQQCSPGGTRRLIGLPYC